MKGLSSLSRLLKGASHQIYLAEAKLGLRHSGNWMMTWNPYNLHYARSTYCMMKRMGYNLNRGDGLNFGKGPHILLQPFVLEGKPANYHVRTHRRLGYVTPLPQSESESDESLSSQSSDSSNWDSDINVRVVFKKLYTNMISIN